MREGGRETERQRDRETERERDSDLYKTTSDKVEVDAQYFLPNNGTVVPKPL
jgi:hypothetical protein